MTHNNTLTDEAICEAIGWEYIRKASNFGNGLAAWKGEGTIHPQFTPDFSTPGPWFDYGIPYIQSLGYWVQIWVLDGGHVIEIRKYNNILYFRAKAPTFPEAMRACLTQLIQGEI